MSHNHHGSNPADGPDPGQAEIPIPLIDADYPLVIEAHVARTIAPHSDLFHELLSVDLHLDVLMVPPEPRRPWFTLVTCGMGLYEMPAPPDVVREKSRMELAICLPRHWAPFYTEDPVFSGKITDGLRVMEGLRFTDRRPPVTPCGPGAWIMILLNLAAKTPIRKDVWFDEGDVTFGLEGSDKPLAPGTELCGLMLAKPRLISDPAFQELQLADGSLVRFMSLIPVHRRELEFKTRHGYAALRKKLRKNGVDELLDLDRPSVCRPGLLERLGF